MSDTDQRLTVLYDHYTDTFTVIRDRENERDRLFLVLIAALGVLGVQVGYSAEAGGIIDTAELGPFTLAVAPLPAAAVLTATWVIVIAIALRYAQRAIIIERQYDYLHTLEAHIATALDEPDVFAREGKAYLREYPAFSDWTWISYVVIFPIVVIVAVAGTIALELTQLGYPLVHKLGDAAMAAATIVSMYLYRLHPPRSVVQRLRRLGTRT